MRALLTEEYLKIREGVTITVKARKVTVKGPKGSITKDFSHMSVDIRIMKMQTKSLKGLHVRVQMWNAPYKVQCGANTLKSLIDNMQIGVTEGFRYRMKLVYAHFPINATIAKDKKTVEIRNFLGGKKIHKINLYPGCTVHLNPSVKDELVFDGIDNAALSLSCAQVSQVCRIGDKDERKFLDGIYVSEKSLTDPIED